MIRRSVPAILIGVAAAVIVACAALLGLLLIRPDLVERHTAGVDPALRYDDAGLDALDAGGVLPIAHNSGDSLSGARRALAHGAQAIEVDVALIGGRLYAAHDDPHHLLGTRFTRRPTLRAVWEATADAEMLFLDLKSASPRFVGALAAFLDEHDDRPVIVVTRDRSTVAGLAAAKPDTPVLLSVADSSTLDEVLSTAPDSLAGLSVRHQLVTAELVTEAADRGWVVLAWTVDDPARYAEMVGLGVAAVATDNLAIVEAMAGTPEIAVPLTTLLDGAST